MEDEDNVKAEVEKGESPLFQAIIANKSANDILAIINRAPSAARQRYIDGNYYPLHLACVYNYRDPQCLVIMKLLDLFPKAAQEKHETNMFDLYDVYEDDYPLHIACRKLSDDVVLKLLDIYPNAAKAKKKGRRMDYPLHIACSHRRSDRVIMKLLEVFPEAAASKSILFEDADDDEEYEDYTYPLHIALKVGLSKEVIQKLLEIYPMALHDRCLPRRSCSFYPLEWAVEHNQSVDVIKLLVTTDPSILQQTDDIGFTPLHTACDNNNVSVVECLLQFPDLPINKRKNYGYTPLHYACCHGKPGVEAAVALILEHPDVDVNAINDHGESVLHSIIVRHNFNSIHLLLNHPCIIINQKDYENRTPLDLLNNKITELSNCNDNDDYKKSSLLRLMEIRNLLQDFSTKRKWQSYEYFHQNYEDWSPRKKMKK